MNLKFTLFFAALLAMPLTSQAMVGGPFDGNDYSQALDDQGIYQTAMRFKNGSGFSQFGVNVNLVATGGITRGSYLNRSIIYCNGLVYIGTASGFVDHEAKLVMGYSNGESAQTNSTFTSQLVTSTFATSQANGGGTANTEFTAKINCISPELRYSGTGQITVLSTNATDIAGTIQTQLTTALTNILATTDPSIPTAANGLPPETPSQKAAFNRQILSAQVQTINSFRSFSSSASSADNGFTQRMTVFGARKFFISRR